MRLQHTPNAFAAYPKCAAADCMVGHIRTRQTAANWMVRHILTRQTAANCMVRHIWTRQTAANCKHRLSLVAPKGFLHF